MDHGGRGGERAEKGRERRGGEGECDVLFYEHSALTKSPEHQDGVIGWCKRPLCIVSS